MPIKRKTYIKKYLKDIGEQRPTGHGGTLRFPVGPASMGMGRRKYSRKEKYRGGYYDDLAEVFESEDEGEDYS